MRNALPDKPFLFCLLLFFWVGTGWEAYAQEPVLGPRAEMMSTPTQDQHWVQPLPDSALLVVSTKPGTGTKKEIFLATKLDHQLRPVWQKRYEHPPSSQLIQLSPEDTSIYLLFGVPGSATLLLYRLNALTGQAFLTLHDLPAPEITVTGMSVAQGQILLAGLQEKTILVLRLDPAKLQTQLLPAVYGLNEQLADFRADTLTKATELAVTESNGYQTRLQVKRLSPKGELLGTHFLSSRTKLGLQQARLTPGTAAGKVLVGTYGVRNSPYSQGIFSGSLTGELQYYSLAQLPNFFDFANTPKLRRYQHRYAKLQAREKPLKPRLQLLLHPIMPHPEGFVVVGEVYQTKYSRTPLAGGHRQPAGRKPSVTDGSFGRTASGQTEPLEHASSGLPAGKIYTSYRFYSAIALLFDRQGKLLRDHSFGLPLDKTLLSPNVTATVTPQGQVIVATLKNGQLHYHSTQQTAPQNPMVLMPAGKSEAQGPEGLVRWYGGKLVAYGFQRDLNGARGKSMVLYLQSVGF